MPFSKFQTSSQVHTFDIDRVFFIYYFLHFVDCVQYTDAIHLVKWHRELCVLLNDGYRKGMCYLNVFNYSDTS